MKRILIALPLVALLSPPAAAEPGDTTIFVSDVEPTPQNAIDRAVFARLKRLKIKPARLCTDQVFVRRVYLDLTGTLPSAEQAKRFIADRAPNKRTALIDDLLAKPAFADYQALKWCDLLRVKAEFPINLWPNAAKAYHHWIRTALRKNVPYDQFARALLTASGSNFRAPQVNFYRAVQSRKPTALAQAVAHTFLGARADRWKKERLRAFSAFFSRVGFKPTREWKEEIVFFDAIAAARAGSTQASLPNGRRVVLRADADPRRVFANWLIHPKNRWFTRCVANRVWSWVFGRGLIHPADDARPGNPPRNKALLLALQKQLVAKRYDLKALYRFILRSHTYQLASIPRVAHPAAEVEHAVYPIRRLEAEVLIDAICQVTGTSEKYSSLIPEPFTIIPAARATTLPDGSITSAFLELFGRSSRDTGRASDRNNRITAAQRLHLLNSSHIRNKLKRSTLLRGLGRRARRNPEQVVKTIYLTLLSRLPSEAERTAVWFHARDPLTKRQDVLGDLFWALINSSEFLYRH